MFKDKLQRIFALATVSALLMTGLNGLPAEVRAEETPAFTVESKADVAPGADVTLKVSLANCSGLAGGKLQVYYDEALTLTDQDDTTIAPADTMLGQAIENRKNKVTPTVNVDSIKDPLPGMKKMVVIFAGSGAAGTGGTITNPISGSGTFMVLNFKVPADAPQGKKYEVRIVCTELTEANNTANNLSGSYTFNPGGVTICSHRDATQTVTTPATCNAAGAATLNCATCGWRGTVQTPIEPNNHSWNAGEVTTAPTCTTEGVKTFTCTGCSKTKTDKVAILGHSWDAGTVTKAPTCTEKGVKTFKCTRTGCTETNAEEVAALGHSWDAGTVTKAPTCTEKGVKTFKCTRTGCTETNAEEVAALGHKVDKWTVTKQATMQAEGAREGTCAVCKVKVTEVIPKLISYEFLEGANQTVSIVVSAGTANAGVSVTIRVNGDFKKFTNVFVDGKEVAKEHYIAKEGSTIIEFTPAYMKTLSEGEHTVTVNYTDGFAQTKLVMTAAEPESKEPESKVPATGDAAPILWLCALLAMSGGAAAMSLRFRKREER